MTYRRRSLKLSLAVLLGLPQILGQQAWAGVAPPQSPGGSPPPPPENQQTPGGSPAPPLDAGTSSGNTGQSPRGSPPPPSDRNTSSVSH